MLTQDEALVGINLAVQYRRADPVPFVFNVRDPEETLTRLKRDREPLYAEVADYRFVTDRQGPRVLVRSIIDQLQEDGIL